MPAGFEQGDNIVAYISTTTYGGQGGAPFQDDLTQVCRLVAIHLRSGSLVDMIQAVWEYPNGALVTGPQHGGSGGAPTTINLLPGELIVRVDLRSGELVDQLTFYTNQGRQYGPYGGGGGSPQSLTNLGAVTGFIGRSGASLDQIGFWIPGKCP